MFVNKDLVKRIKAQHPSDTRIRLECMGYAPRPITTGTRGAVRIVDDIGTACLDGGETG